MKKRIKKIAIIGLIIFLLMQLYQPARNLDYGQVLPVHIEEAYDMPSNVCQIFRTSCYDCYSNNTNYPWYSNVQPVRAFLAPYSRR